VAVKRWLAGILILGVALVCAFSPGCAGLGDALDDEFDKYPECARRALAEFHSCAAEKEKAASGGLVNPP
jgi:hypothetical protein